jgi:CMP-N-acetylneuraminic acid synthetase
VIALIPARGGSKRLPRKNIRDFAGRPLIAWSIAMARAVEDVARTIVSTDDPEIAEISRAFGAEVRMRPAELASDTATTASVVRHVLDELAHEGHHPDGVLLLQPNCPLRPYSVVRAALDTFYAFPADSVVSVTASTEKQGQIAGGYFRPAYRPGTRSQDMPPTYYENGVVYVSRAPMVRHTGELFGQRIYPLVTERMFALGDIDTELDFEIAEHLFRAHRDLFALPSSPSTPPSPPSPRNACAPSN